MNDATLLFALFVAIYISECCGWTSKHTVLFRQWFGGRKYPSKHWNWRLPGFGNQKYGLHLRHVLPPLGNVFHCPVWPASLSPAGALGWVPFCMDRADRPDQSAVFVKWPTNTDEADDLAIYAEDRVVFVGKQRLFQCATEAQTRRILHTLHEVSLAPDAEARAKVIESAWQSAFDVDKIRGALAAYSQSTGRSRVIANWLFVHLFIIGPLAVYLRGLARVWLPLTAVLAMLMTSAAISFYRTHRRLQPQLTEERWKHTLIVLLSPSGAVRSLDALARDQLIGFHPLAVASVTLTHKRFVDFARRYVLDLRFAMPSRIQAVSHVRDTLQWHMRREAQQIRAFLQRLDLAVDELTLGDPPDDEACLSYCPRCQCQFVIPAAPESHCTLCDLPLVAFA